MKRWFFFGLLSLTMVLAHAGEPIRLYKQFMVGTPKAYLQKALTLEDCSQKYEQGTLCSTTHSLAGENAEIAFRFLKDRLVSVVLYMPLTDASKIQKMYYALKTQFDLALIEDGQNRFDILEVSANTFNKSEFTQLIADFENEAYQKQSIKYTFISKDEFLSQSRRARNFADLFKDAPINMRAVTYSIGRQNNQVVGTLTFLVPGITESYLDQNPIVEDF